MSYTLKMTNVLLVQFIEQIYYIVSQVNGVHEKNT